MRDVNIFFLEGDPAGEVDLTSSSSTINLPRGRLVDPWSGTPDQTTEVLPASQSLDSKVTTGLTAYINRDRLFSDLSGDRSAGPSPTDCSLCPSISFPPRLDRAPCICRSSNVGEPRMQNRCTTSKKLGMRHHRHSSHRPSRVKLARPASPASTATRRSQCLTPACFQTVLAPSAPAFVFFFM